MSLSMDDYGGLLDRALSKITQPGGSGERFELPIAMVQIIGQRTIVVNFSDVVDRLNRDPHHVLKYLARRWLLRGRMRVVVATSRAGFHVRRLTDSSMSTRTGLSSVPSVTDRILVL